MTTATPVRINRAAFEEFEGRLNNARATLIALVPRRSNDLTETQRLLDKAHVMREARASWLRILESGVTPEEALVAFKARLAQRQSSTFQSKGERQGLALLADYVRNLEA